MSPNDRPILITGVPRSGTSMTAGLFALPGFYGGELFAGNKDNKKGFFENKQIREHIVKRRLAAAGIDVLAQTIWKFPEEIIQDKYKALNSKSPLILKKEIEAILQRENRTIFRHDDTETKIWNSNWFYKCAKLPLFGTIWSRAWPAATVIIVKRDRSTHVNSLLRTGFMKCCSTAEGWDEWVDVYDDYINRLQNLFSDIEVVYFEDITNGNFDRIREIIEGRGISFDEEKAMEFLYVPSN